MENKILIFTNSEIIDSEIIANELNGENDWTKISNRKDLTMEQIEAYKNHLDWFYILKNYENIPNTLIDEMLTTDKISKTNTSFEYIAKNHANDKEFIKKYNKDLDLTLVSKHNKFGVNDMVQIIEIPKVGSGASIGIGSDSYPYTVIEISNGGKLIKVQRDNHKPSKGFDYFSNQIYDYTSNPDAGVEEYKLKKDGNYYDKYNGKIYTNGRRYYQNPSF